MPPTLEREPPRNESRRESSCTNSERFDLRLIRRELNTEVKACLALHFDACSLLDWSTFEAMLGLDLSLAVFKRVWSKLGWVGEDTRLSVLLNVALNR